MNRATTPRPKTLATLACLGLFADPKIGLKAKTCGKRTATLCMGMCPECVMLWNQAVSRSLIKNDPLLKKIRQISRSKGTKKDIVQKLEKLLNSLGTSMGLP